MLFQIVLAVVAAAVLFSGKALYTSGRLPFSIRRRRASELNNAASDPISSSVPDVDALPVDESAVPDSTITTIWAIGDLHGDAMCARYWLNRTGLIDSETDAWKGSTSKLVFVGDYVDKGPTSLETVQLVKSLEERYSNVVALMGNHELEVLNDRLPPEQRRRYWYQLPYSTVHPDDMLSYAPENEVTADTHRALDILYDLALDEIYGKNQFRSVDFSPYGEKSICNLIEDEAESKMVREELDKLQNYYINSYSSDTELGQWVEKRPITHIHEDLIFLHGGINPQIMDIDGGVPSASDLSDLNSAFASSSSTSYLSPFMKSLHGQIVYDLVTYRGNHKSCREVEFVAERLNVSKVIVGHTPDDNVRVMCDESFLAIDSALGRWIRVNGNQYCRGDVTRNSKNGRYTCDKIADSCEGGIVRLDRKEEGGWDVNVIT